MTAHNKPHTNVNVFQALAENALDAILITDARGKVTFANRAAYQLFGCDYEKQEMIGSDRGSYWPEETKAHLGQEMRQALEGRWRGELRGKRTDGSTFDAQVSIFPVPDPQGQIIARAMSIRDMTERKRSETALNEEQNLFRILIDSVPDSIYFKNKESRFIRVNQAMAQRFGFQKPEDALGKTDFDLFTEEHARPAFEDEQEIIRTGQPIVDKEEKETCADGTIRWVSTTKLALRNARGEVVGTFGISRDISERKQAEAERARLQEQVIEAQRHTLQELSTPIIPVMERIIVMPLIGSIDSLRAKDITRTLLAGISRYRAKVVIVDITGVPLVDSGVADHLNKTIQAARLKGAQTIVTGMSDAVAEAIVDLGIDWSGIATLSDLQTGLIYALNSLGMKLGKA